MNTKLVFVLTIILIIGAGLFMFIKKQKEEAVPLVTELVSSDQAVVEPVGKTIDETPVKAEKPKAEKAKPKSEPKRVQKVKKETPKKMKHAVIETNQGSIEVELWEEKTPKTVANFAKLAKEKFYEGIYFHRVIPNFMIQGGCPNTKDSDRMNDGTGDPGYKFEDECYEEGGEISGKIETDDEAFSVFTKVLLPYLQKNQDPDKDILELARACQEAQSGVPLKAHPVEYYLTKTGFKGKLNIQGKLVGSVDYGTLCMANSGPNTNGSQFFIVTNKNGSPHLNGKHTVFGRVTKGMDIVHKIENLPRDKRDNPLPANQAVIKSVTVK